jgi:hypothetical protein
MSNSSIVVIGNRNRLTPQDVIDFFNNHELNPLFVLVKFSLYNETNK